METINISPLNRVEGDLDVEIEVEDGRVARARASARMFRGFERILLGREPTDSIVFTPRICGICTTGHQTASALALDEVRRTLGTLPVVGVVQPGAQAAARASAISR